MAIGSALFSKMGMRKRKSLIKDRFNITLSHEELENLEHMTNIVQDKYEQGLREGEAIGVAKGIEEGKAIERRNSMETIINSAISISESTGIPAERILSAMDIPEEDRASYEAELAKRLS